MKDAESSVLDIKGIAAGEENGFPPFSGNPGEDGGHEEEEIAAVIAAIREHTERAHD